MYRDGGRKRVRKGSLRARRGQWKEKIEDNEYDRESGEVELNKKDT